MTQSQASAASASSCCSDNSPSPTLLESTLTCPNCGHTTTETMPIDACVYFHECASCHTVLKPLAGDCCVFCSYGSVKCPPIQAGNSCC
ncbi:hypothetical protein ABIB44_001452 [Hymenobacter sp. UYCo722]